MLMCDKRYVDAWYKMCVFHTLECSSVALWGSKGIYCLLYLNKGTHSPFFPNRFNWQIWMEAVVSECIMFLWSHVTHVGSYQEVPLMPSLLRQKVALSIGSVLVKKSSYSWLLLKMVEIARLKQTTLNCVISRITQPCAIHLCCYGMPTTKKDFSAKEHTKSTPPSRFVYECIMK